MKKSTMTPSKLALYIGVPLGLLGVTGLVIATKKKSKNISKEIEAANNSTIPNPTTGQPSINLYDTANTIADALGTNVGWWSPYNWSEDEITAAVAILQVPDQYIPQLEQIYAAKYDRNLREDAQNYLDEYWDQVKSKFL